MWAGLGLGGEERERSGWADAVYALVHPVIGVQFGGPAEPKNATGNGTHAHPTQGALTGRVALLWPGRNVRLNASTASPQNRRGTWSHENTRSQLPQNPVTSHAHEHFGFYLQVVSRLS
ncbi:hypothetical protein E2C01_072427 [Portunus trituberculatus]|uniref:Uncharacterized protein n=1 Tax=Portunus trituberculatus TaxID=210409 RepID=A0A5B7I8X7_PORTR|nr:hypothetical protein [Portunus trituberculatus]